MQLLSMNQPNYGTQHSQHDYVPVNEITKINHTQNKVATTLKGYAQTIFGPALLLGMGAVSWKAALIINEPDRNLDDDFVGDSVGIAFLATAILMVGVASRFFKLKDEQDQPALYIPGPFTLLTIACIGFAIGVKQQHDAAVPIWNELNAENGVINASNRIALANYKNEVGGCYEHISDHIEEFTRSGCTICVDGYTTTLQVDDFYLSQMTKVLINQTICATPSDGLSRYWKNFESHTLNETRSVWPCGFPIITNSAIETADRMILSGKLAVYTPFSIEVTPQKGSSCYDVQGYAFRPYFPFTYCKGIIPKPFPNDQFSCLTSAFQDYIGNYISTFQPYTPLSEVIIPSMTIKLVEGNSARDQYIICATFGTVLFLVCVPAELRKKPKNVQENKPLLTT